MILEIRCVATRSDVIYHLMPVPFSLIEQLKRCQSHHNQPLGILRDAKEDETVNKTLQSSNLIVKKCSVKAPGEGWLIL